MLCKTWYPDNTVIIVIFQIFFDVSYLVNYLVNVFFPWEVELYNNEIFFSEQPRAMK
jgi:hypothetical protein